jgi:hypothetical protein
VAVSITTFSELSQRVSVRFSECCVGLHLSLNEDTVVEQQAANDFMGVRRRLNIGNLLKNVSAEVCCARGPFCSTIMHIRIPL